MDAYIKGITQTIFETFIQLDAGHIKVIPKKAVDRSRPLPLDKGIKNISRLLRLIKAEPGITEVSPRIRFPVLLENDGNSIPALGVALYPSREQRLMNLESQLVAGSVPSDSSWETLLGIKLAEKLGLTVGDELFMVTTDSYGGLGPGLYKIAGIVQSGVGYIDKKTFYVPLRAAQDQLALDDGALEIVCRVENGLIESIPVAASLNERLKGDSSEGGNPDIVALPWQKQGNLYDLLSPVKVYSLILMLLLGIIALTTVVNTILMSVMERTREIGALRALGFDRSTIVKMIISESMLIGVVGTLAGVNFGLTIALILQHTGIDFSNAVESIEMPMKPIVYPNPDVLTAVKAAIFGLFLALVAAWYPARKAVKLTPAEAIRSN